MSAGRGLSFRSRLNAEGHKGYEPLRRPGEIVKELVPRNNQILNAAGDHSLDFISVQLNKLDGKDSDKLYQLVNLMKVACTKEEHLKNLGCIIYKYGVESKLNAHIGALICQHLENFKVDQAKFRTVMLKHLQNDYEDRKLTYTKLDKFILNVTFLCEIEYHMRLADGTRFAVFDEPIINYFIMLVDGGSEKEVETFAEQVAKCGKDLQASKPECFEKLLVIVRKKIVSESSISVASRALLLETLEKILNLWEPVGSSAKNFYELMSKPIITFCE